MRTVTAKQLAWALDCDDRTIRNREGSTIPKPIDPDAKPHVYDLRMVLSLVNGPERDLICEKLKVKINLVVLENEEEASGYVPSSSPERERDFF